MPLAKYCEYYVKPKNIVLVDEMMMMITMIGLKLRENETVIFATNLDESIYAWLSLHIYFLFWYIILYFKWKQIFPFIIMKLENGI